VVGVDRVWVHDLVVLLGSSGAVSGRSRRCRRSHSSSWSWLFDPARAAGPVCGRLPYHMESERQGRSPPQHERLGRAKPSGLGLAAMSSRWLRDGLSRCWRSKQLNQFALRGRSGCGTAGPVARRHGAPQLDHSWEVDVIGVQQAAEEERPWRVGDLPLQRTVAAALHRPSPVELAVLGEHVRSEGATRSRGRGAGRERAQAAMVRSARSAPAALARSTRNRAPSDSNSSKGLCGRRERYAWAHARERWLPSSSGPTGPLAKPPRRHSQRHGPGPRPHCGLYVVDRRASPTSRPGPGAGRPAGSATPSSTATPMPACSSATGFQDGVSQATEPH
jgi:hypothetical protein